jgi:molybdopterin-synthase adenylyltransferase
MALDGFALRPRRGRGVGVVDSSQLGTFNSCSAALARSACGTRQVPARRLYRPPHGNVAPAEAPGSNETIMDFTDEQIERYARHIVLKEVGGVGQQRLLGAKVLVIGAGGLGCPITLYLAAAGVGTIGVVDDDVVSLSNLQRQIAHATARIGVAKTASAAAAVAAINPDVRLVEHRTRVGADNAAELIAAYDLVADGSDNFATRFLVNDACYFAGKTLVTAAIAEFDGQLATFKAYRDGDHPCYRCVFREVPPGDFDEGCARDGVLGALAGVMGSLQAVEVLKELLGIGESLSGSLTIYDGLGGGFHRMAVHRDPECTLCGADPTIRDLSIHRRRAPQAAPAEAT